MRSFRACAPHVLSVCSLFTLSCSEDSEPAAEPSGPIQPVAPDDAVPASVSISTPSQAFQGTLQVELTTSVVNAELRFTTDGTPPNGTSELYSAALSVTQTTQLRAQAFVAGMAQGASASALYVARTFDASSNLPLLILDGYGGGKPEDKEVYRDVAFMAFEPISGSAALSHLPRVATRAGWHLRGQSSATFEQAPYRIELWDEKNEDAEYPLLGMPAEADWVLIGPYVDRSLIRNALAYDLGREMGLVAPRYAFAEVYINPDGGPLTAEHYEGIYMLGETIKNDKNRLNLQQLESDESALPEIAGGYIFKFDWAAVEADASTLSCTGSAPISMSGGFGGGFGGGGFGGAATPGTCWADLEVVDPSDINAQQSEWITTYVQQFHDQLHAEPVGAYTEQIDVGSFVDTFLLNEFTRNMDAFVRSLYFYKDRAGLLTAGPLWDFNLTFACGGTFGNTETAGWQFQQRLGSNDWFHRLATDSAFMQRVASRWRELRSGLFSDAALNARVDQLIAPLAEAAVRDFERWPVSAVRGGIFSFPQGDTWQAQLEAIRSWMPQRAAWLDGAVDEPINP